MPARVRSSRWIVTSAVLVLAALVAAHFGIVSSRARLARQAALAQLAAQRRQLDALAAHYLRRPDVAPPRLEGGFPCVVATVGEGKAFPRLGRCGMPAAPSGPVDQFEVDPRWGSFILRQTDLYLEDVFEVPLTRTYNSTAYRPEMLAFGRNASHPFDIAPVGTRHPYTYLMLTLADGTFLFFGRVSPGTGFADAVYQHTETATRFYRAVIGWNGAGWTARLADGARMEFPEAYNAKNLAQGAATEMTDASGRRLELRRDRRRNLLEIRTPHARSIRLAYDDYARIQSAQDDAGHWARYQYDSQGMLTDAVLSSGSARHYSYDGTSMTQVEDENRRVLVQNSYKSGYLARQVFGNGEVYTYTYTGAPGVSYALRATVTATDGSQSELELASSVPDAIKHPPD
jgi:YD repeat-containing protein